MKTKCYQLVYAKGKSAVAIGFTRAECVRNYIDIYFEPGVIYPAKVRLHELIKEGHFLVIECEVTPSG